MNKKNEDEESFYNFDYSVQCKKLIAKFVKHNSTFTQEYNGNVIIREVKTYETIYSWDDKLKKFTIKSKKIV